MRLLLESHNKGSSDQKKIWDPEHGRFGDFETLVKTLRERLLLTEYPREIISLSRSEEGSRLDQWQVLVLQDHALAVRDFGNKRIGICRLPDAQLTRIRDYLSTYQVDKLPLLQRPIADGTSYHYFHATREGVSTLFMNNPPTRRLDHSPSVFFGSNKHVSNGIVIYGQLVNVIVNAFESLDIKLSYDTKAFSFKQVANIEGLDIRSTAMWVDEAEGIVYAAVNGDLLKVPLR